MKKIGICEKCGGKIIQAGNGNVFCEDCADKDFGQRLQEFSDRKEKQKIVRWGCSIYYQGRDIKL